MNESAINIPAIAAALVTKPYTSQEADELSLKVADLYEYVIVVPTLGCVLLVYIILILVYTMHSFPH